MTGGVVCGYFLLMMRRARLNGTGDLGHDGKPIWQSLVRTMFEHDDAEEGGAAGAAGGKSDRGDAVAAAKARAAVMAWPQVVVSGPEDGGATGAAHVTLAPGASEPRQGVAVARADSTYLA